MPPGLVMALSFPFWLTLSLKLVVTIDIQVNASEKSVSPKLLFTTSRLYTQIFLSLILELIVSSLILISSGTSLPFGGVFGSSFRRLLLLVALTRSLPCYQCCSRFCFSCVIAVVVLFEQAVSGEEQNLLSLANLK